MPVRTSLKRALVAAAALAFPAAAAAQSVLVDIHDLTPREHRYEGFVLSSPGAVRVQAVGAEPWRESRRNRNRDWWGPEDERDVWPAACWILNARTREVVWDLRTARTQRSDDGLHHFDGSIELPAGTYEAHYASFPATSFWSDNGNWNLREILRGLSRKSRTERYGGPYVDDGAFREFELVIKGNGRPARDADLDDALHAYTGSAIVSLRPAGPDSSDRYGFQLTRPTDIEVFAEGELRRDGDFDYAWIMNADTRDRVWTMTYRESEHAGGANKNRVERASIHLPAGRYVAYFVTDDTHHPGEWNNVPPFDPDLWGLTLRVSDAAARAAVRPFVYEPVPTGQTIVSLIGIGDDESRSDGFTLKQPLEIAIYAMGEGRDGEMYDYAWIVDARSRHRVWTMDYEATEHAGGAEKNRLYEGTLKLDAGSYLVYYRSDGSHSAHEWNAARPAESRYWGVSIFPASGSLNKAIVAPYDRTAGRGGPVLAELVRVGDNERESATFRLDREMDVQVYALGEGVGRDMVDYAWIEVQGTGRVVWEMTYRTSEHAGGARKNRVFDGTINLPAGMYVVHYESDGSHSYEDWNDDPPDDPEAWGVTVRRATPTP
jgi:hypothetical protein